MAEVTVATEIAASVWKIQASPGDRVEEGDVLLILESMKMEIPVLAPRAGTVTAVLVQEGEQVEEAQAVAALDA